MPPSLRVLDLVLIGFGHVGRGFAGLLADRARLLELDHGLRPRVVAIATARHGCVLDPSGVDACRAAELVAGGGSLASLQPPGITPPADTHVLLEQLGARQRDEPLVVVETTTLNVQDGEPATSHILRALAAGAHVITANKGPIACAWPEVRDAAARAGRHVLFEGVVMDGVPVFNLVRETLPALRITALRGIVNTTTNYILAEMEKNRELAEALPEMQAQGIAEADASLDIDGWDAAAKAAALGNVLMDARLTPAAVERGGLAGLRASDIRAAIDAGCRIKLVIRVVRATGGITASVRPERVPLDDLLARIHGTMNALTISTDRLGDITVVQHGGSVVETAYGLLSDLVTLRRRL